MRLKQHGVAAWFVILAVAGVFAAPAAAAAKVTVLPDLSCETPAGPQKMDLYLPEGSGRFPGVVWMHGSGGDKAHPRDRSVCADLAGAGFIVASINYEPNNTPSPEAVVACKSAVRFLRASADKYPVDERRIGVAGVSWGGSLALLVGFTSQDPLFEVKDIYPGVSDQVSLVVSLSGPTDLLQLPQPPVLSEHKAALEEHLKRFSPLNCVTPEAPPVLLVHGTGDKVIPYEQAVQLDKRLAKARVPHRLVTLDRVGHTYSLATTNGRPLPVDLRVVVVDFLRTHFAAVK